jgi:hypothetical protein
MSCFVPRILYANPPFRGLAFAGYRGDGYGVELKWIQAWSGSPPFQVVYNLYYSTHKDDVFTEGVKYVITDATKLQSIIDGLTPGDVYFFAVRGALQNPDDVSLSGLPSIENFKLYPEAMLLEDIGPTDLAIKVSDIALFPAKGVVQIGAELIAYTGLDLPNSALVLSDVSKRGYYDTEARLHQTDGYDGYVYRDPLVKFFIGFEDGNQSVVLTENRFFEPHYARTDADGYRTQKDLLTTDFSDDEAEQIDFAPFDYAGYRRTDPVDLLAGKCVGSYYGGQYFCADGYGGVGMQVRGLDIATINDQRQEVLLSTTGRPCVLVKRLWTGITCSCVSPSRETPESRCPRCFGTGFVTGYEQFYNPRRSDGRILVRFDPTVEDLLPMDAGLESDFKPNAWTLSVPILKDRDFLIRFNKDGTEEFRYEILNVTRNYILLDNVGGQKFACVRVRKTDPIYQWRAFRNTANMPSTLTTSVGQVSGPGGILPHTHTIVINENVITLVQINQTTGVSQGHNHPIINGAVQEVLGHTHSIILP